MKWPNYESHILWISPTTVVLSNILHDMIQYLQCRSSTISHNDSHQHHSIHRHAPPQRPPILQTHIQLWRTRHTRLAIPGHLTHGRRYRYYIWNLCFVQIQWRRKWETNSKFCKQIWQCGGIGIDSIYQFGTRGRGNQFGRSRTHLLLWDNHADCPRSHFFRDHFDLYRVAKTRTSDCFHRMCVSEHGDCHDFLSCAIQGGGAAESSGGSILVYWDTNFFSWDLLFSCVEDGMDQGSCQWEYCQGYSSELSKWRDDFRCGWEWKWK